MIINIKPLSVNEAWKGQRFKTDKYKAFEKYCLLLLPQIAIPEPPYQISYTFAFSNPAADLMNPEKLITDILCKKYGFNDKDIYRMVVNKRIIRQGEEFFKFEILHFESTY